MTHPLDRPLPNSLDAEKAVLGALLLSPVQAGSTIRGSLCGTEFYYSHHQLIYGTASKMIDAGKTLDLVTLTQRLREIHQLDEIGGATYLADLVSACASTTNVEPYIEIVLEKSLRRELIGMGHTLITKSYEESEDIETVHSEACAGILNATQGQTRIQTASDGIQDGIEHYEASLTSESRLLGLSTGFDDLDYLTRGLEPKTVYCIGGRPGTGKTALASAIATHVAEIEKVPVGFLSLEQSTRALCMRAVASRAGVNIRYPKELSQDDHDAVVKASMEIRKLPLFIDDRASLRLSQVRSVCRSMKSQYGCRLFILDHLQLTKPESKQKTYDHLRDFTAGIHETAKELDAPFILLSQLNRVPENEDRLPKLGDLRECGSIEQDCDCILLLSKVEKEQREKVFERYKKLKELDEKELALLTRANLAKQREGPGGPWVHIFLAFEKQFTRYRNLRFPGRQQNLVTEPETTAADLQPH